VHRGGTHKLCYLRSTLHQEWWRGDLKIPILPLTPLPIVDAQSSTWSTSSTSKLTQRGTKHEIYASHAHKRLVWLTRSCDPGRLTMHKVGPLDSGLLRPRTLPLVHGPLGNHYGVQDTSRILWDMICNRPNQIYHVFLGSLQLSKENPKYIRGLGASQERRSRHLYIHRSRVVIHHRQYWDLLGFILYHKEKIIHSPQIGSKIFWMVFTEAQICIYVSHLCYNQILASVCPHR
jgi:hypothetical protein